MPSPEFEFELKVDRGTGADALADAVAAEILRHIGYQAGASAGVADAIHGALDEVCTCGRACHVRFRARSGELEILVSTGGEATRRVVCPIPS